MQLKDSITLFTNSTILFFIERRCICHDASNERKKAKDQQRKAECRFHLGIPRPQQNLASISKKRTKKFRAERIILNRLLLNYLIGRRGLWERDQVLSIVSYSFGDPWVWRRGESLKDGNGNSAEEACWMRRWTIFVGGSTGSFDTGALLLLPCVFQFLREYLHNQTRVIFEQ